MSYYASISTEGYKEANVAIDKLTIQMKGLLPSSSTATEDVFKPCTVNSSVHVKDPGVAATKGSTRQTKKCGGKVRKCGNCGQAGHTKKSCHAHIQNNISVMASNGDATTGSTLQPSAYADLVQSCDSEYTGTSDGHCEPFAFQNTKVPMATGGNQLNEDIYSMPTSTHGMYMQQNHWWRPHNFMS